MTREEAIRRIKAWNLDSDDMEVLAVVIPELAESEKEKKMLAVISYKISQHQGNDERSLFTPDEAEFIDGMEDKLKSLRPQPKQNVNDMITPNKEFFQWIYNRLVDVHNENPNVDYMISFKKRIEELSFDKPSWKPSEEQKEALEYVIRDYREDSCNATANYLQEILDHLKNM